MHAQPMSTHDQRYTVVYNGEIYNHLKLRQRLELGGIEYNWKGLSDTETLLACISHWGIEETLKNLKACFCLQYGIKRNQFYIWLAMQLVKTSYWAWLVKMLFLIRVKSFYVNTQIFQKNSKEGLKYFF